jgi:hypothetical protein
VAAADKVTQLVRGRVVLEGVAGHEHQADRLGRVDDQLSLNPPRI